LVHLLLLGHLVVGKLGLVHVSLAGDGPEDGRLCFPSIDLPLHLFCVGRDEGDPLPEILHFL
jgi:hypothetical protein